MNVNRLDSKMFLDEIEVLATRSKYMRVLTCDPRRGMYRTLLGCQEPPPQYIYCECEGDGIGGGEIRIWDPAFEEREDDNAHEETPE